MAINHNKKNGHRGVCRGDVKRSQKQTEGIGKVSLRRAVCIPDKIYESDLEVVFIKE